MDDLRSVSGSIECDADRGVVLKILEDGTRAPEWAPAFTDVAMRDGLIWRGRKGGREFEFRIAVHPDAGTVDYLLEIAPGREGGAYLRVIPRAGEGCVISMTLPVRPGTDAAEVRETLGAELAAIARLATSAE